jgi:ribosome-binding factor A
VAGNRPEKVGEQIRIELTELLAREVHDPGVGFVTLTKVKVSPDLQLARVYYTSFGDAKAQKESAKALGRATPFLRRQVAQRVRLRRVPELQFFYDESIANHDRIEQILQELKAEALSHGEGGPATETAAGAEPPDTASERREASHANGAGTGAPASERAGGSGAAQLPDTASERAGGSGGAEPPAKE